MSIILQKGVQTFCKITNDESYSLEIALLLDLQRV